MEREQYNEIMTALNATTDTAVIQQNTATLISDYDEQLTTIETLQKENEELKKANSNLLSVNNKLFLSRGTQTDEKNDDLGGATGKDNEDSHDKPTTTINDLFNGKGEFN